MDALTTGLVDPPRANSDARPNRDRDLLRYIGRHGAVSIEHVMAALGVGPDFFDANVAPELRLVRRGRKRLVPVRELEQWLAENAAQPVASEVAR